MDRTLARFKRESALRRPSAVALIAASLAIVIAAERDLHGRPADAVRGSKPLWRLLCLNALGATAYLIWGRRPARA